MTILTLVREKVTYDKIKKASTKEGTLISVKRYAQMQPLCFDDILLVPKQSNVQSRHSVDLSMTFGVHYPITLQLPIIAAPMDTVCGFDMCVVLAQYGGMGILHRYTPMNIMLQYAEQLTQDDYLFGVAVGATKTYLEDAKQLYDAGARVILIDIANGHSRYAIQAVQGLRNEFGDTIHIMAGNIATRDGYQELAEAGVDSIRVGIGGGSACTTRLVSGHGLPTLASLLDITEHAQETNVGVIADGGIRNSGDMVKSFAAGAHAVMVGGMLAGTTQAPGDILTDHHGNEVKVYRGMASAQTQKDVHGSVSVAEGITTTIPYKGDVEHILYAMKGGLGSGCSYSGVTELKNLNKNAEYVIVSANTLRESIPHAGERLLNE